MKKTRLTSKERAIFNEMQHEYVALKFDYKRRLRNALLCLAQGDPRWMVWIEKNFKPHKRIGKRELLMIEARARNIVLRNYRYFDRKNVGGMIFDHDWAFSDDGSLSPG
jgi:hypothetical protein